MKHILLLASVALCGVGFAEVSTLERDFVNPPHAAKPHTWYHLMNGNVTKEGITADFEALAKIGMGGVQMFDAGCNIPPGPLAFNSPEWFDMFRHAAKEARRLGLEICIPNCSGWSSSGGPWNMPSNGMKFVTTREVKVTGPKKFHAKLPRETKDNGFYEDIAVLAFPTPAAELADFSAVKASGDDKTYMLSCAEPFTMRGVSFLFEFPWVWAGDATIQLESSSDGVLFKPYETVEIPLARSGGADRGFRYHAFAKPLTTRALRAKIVKSSTDKMKFKNLRPESKMSISNLKSKTFEIRQEVRLDNAVSTPDQIVAPSAIRNITASLSADGTLDWDVPAGNWTILRLGYVCNGRRNHPASDHGVGLEVDKLSATAMDYHFDQYVAVLCERLGSLAGAVETGFNNILVDSYEVGSQNWTQRLDATFEKRMGYSIVPYLPVFAGHVVGSVDVTERFLEDFRRVVADLFAENYAGALARKCHEKGLMLSLEPYGSSPSDNLQYGEYADIPMGEFWSNAGSNSQYVNEGNAIFPAYIAHVWGKKFVATESFTANPGSGGRWQTTPYSIKAQGDRVFARGVNRIIYHRYTHQPWPNSAYLPGMTMGRWGMHFDRTQTWWDYGSGWIRYQSRCQAMLQAGKFVADALFFCGEQAPNQGGNTDGGSKVNMTLPAGYAWDICPKDALMKLRVEKGQVVVPGGVKYKLLVLPPQETMSLGVLKKVDELISAGAKVCAAVRPKRSPGLVGYPDADGELQAAVGKVWAKGVLECAPAEALKRLDIAPDFMVANESDGQTKGIAYIHRCSSEGDWYFVAVPNAKPISFETSFRTQGLVPEIWNAETGAIGEAPVWRTEGERTVVRLDFEPSGSAFVVFRRPMTGDHLVSLNVNAAPPPKMTSNAKIEIVKAEYGAFELGKVMDFTARLQSYVKDGVLDVVIGNQLAGRDPLHLTPKTARIVYRVNGVENKVSLREFARLTVPSCFKTVTQPQQLEVLTAGPAKGACLASVPLTAELAFASGKTRTVTAEPPKPQVVDGAWSVSFPHGFVPNPLADGADETLTFERLTDWIDHPLEGVKYFSGTATYRKCVTNSFAAKPGERLLLDLGEVEHVAQATVNGHEYPAMWRPPFRVDITDVVKPGEPIVLMIKVANLWANRLIGDDRTKKDDCEWVGQKKNGVKEIGIRAIPDWVKAGRKSPTGRVTFTTWKHWDKDDELQTSGLLGPVRLWTLVPAK